jgi:hypothetical protein
MHHALHDCRLLLITNSCPASTLPFMIGMLLLLLARPVTLQDTVAEMAKDIKAKRTGEMSTNAAELYAFINRVSRAADGACGAGVHNMEGLLQVLQLRSTCCSQRAAVSVSMSNKC